MGRRAIALPDLAVLMEDSAELIADMLKVTRDTMEELNAKLSVYVPDSEISRLNAAAGRASVPVSEDTFRVSHRYAGGPG